MTTLNASRRISWLLSAAVVASAACFGDTTGPDDRDAVAGLQLVVGPPGGGGAITSQVILLANGQVAGGPLRVPVGRSTIIARPLDDAGIPVSSAVASTLRLTVNTPAGNAGGITFERDPAQPLAGTVTATTATPAATPVAVNIGAQRIADSVWPIGPFAVPVTVVASAP
jgi:hypothetical protein